MTASDDFITCSFVNDSHGKLARCDEALATEERCISQRRAMAASTPAFAATNRDDASHACAANAYEALRTKFAQNPALLRCDSQSSIFDARDRYAGTS